jgi:hypothetical protein
MDGGQPDILEQEQFWLFTYTFQDKVKVGIYEDLCIDFSELDLY